MKKRGQGYLCALANQSVAEVRPVANAIDDERVAGRDAVLQHLLGDAGDPRFLDDRSGKIARVILEQGLVDPKDFTGPQEDPALDRTAYLARQFDLADLNDEPVTVGAALLEQHRAGLHRFGRKHICQIGDLHDMPPPVAQPRTEKLLSSLISRLRE